MSWINGDGLYVKFGTEEAVTHRGGSVKNVDGRYEFQFIVDWKDLLSATDTILGSASGVQTGSFGVLIPKGLHIEELEIVATTAFTSSGTIGSSTLSMGFIREDRSTTYDVDGLLTTSFVAGVLDAAGEKTVIRIGSTGCGALVGTVLANDGLIMVANSAHSSHPYTAGRANVVVRGFYPDTQTVTP